VTCSTTVCEHHRYEAQVSCVASGWFNGNLHSDSDDSDRKDTAVAQRIAERCALKCRHRELVENRIFGRRREFRNDGKGWRIGASRRNHGLIASGSSVRYHAIAVRYCVTPIQALGIDRCRVNTTRIPAARAAACADYQGGYWYYFDLSNGGCYMAPGTPMGYRTRTKRSKRLVDIVACNHPEALVDNDGFAEESFISPSMVLPLSDVAEDDGLRLCGWKVHRSVEPTV
jgi:hypothetical protein